MVKQIRLPDRLKTIAGYINNGASVADIGTDHGFLPVFLAQNGLARRIVASDISARSLDSARCSAIKYNVFEMITFITAPGLKSIFTADDNGNCGIDTIVISGMGGETIAGILEDAPRIKNRGIKLILQPQSKIDVLCRFLYDNGFRISSTKVAFDRGRKYTVIVCEVIDSA